MGYRCHHSGYLGIVLHSIELPPSPAEQFIFRKVVVQQIGSTKRLTFAWDPKSYSLPAETNWALEAFLTNSKVSQNVQSHCILS